jgi:hypothetical protein
MTDYILTATRFDEVLERNEKGRPIKVIKHRRGAVLTGLDDSEVARLTKAGAIAPVDTSADSEAPDLEPQNPPSGDVDSFGLELPKKAGTAKAWEDYAVALFEKSEGKAGLNREDAEQATKQQLIELFS